MAYGFVWMLCGVWFAVGLALGVMYERYVRTPRRLEREHDEALRRERRSVGAVPQHHDHLHFGTAGSSAPEGGTVQIDFAQGAPPPGYAFGGPPASSAVVEANVEGSPPTCPRHALCARPPGHRGPCAEYFIDSDRRGRWRVLHASEQPTREVRPPAPEPEGDDGA